jgi:hypothetical protein
MTNLAVHTLGARSRRLRPPSIHELRFGMQGREEGPYNRPDKRPILRARDQPRFFENGQQKCRTVAARAP